MSPSTSRVIILGFVLATLVAGGVLFVRSFRPPEGSDGRETNVADAPAGGRTQATEPGDAADAADAPPIGGLVDDPLLPGITEAPDIPASAAHRGLKKIGERIRDAVLADGTIGDEEVPGVSFAASVSQAQRKRFVELAPGVLCGCGCGQDLLECRRDDLACPKSPALRDSLIAAVRAGS
jgi:hypothetical protein